MPLGLSSKSVRPLKGRQAPTVQDVLHGSTAPALTAESKAGLSAQAALASAASERWEAAAKEREKVATTQREADDALYKQIIQRQATHRKLTF